MEADSGRVTFHDTASEEFIRRTHTLLQGKYKGWDTLHDTEPPPASYTVSIRGMEYTYNKGYIGVQVKFRPVYYSKNPWFGDWQIASPLPLQPGAVNVYRKDGTSSIHVVGSPILKGGTNRIVNEYGQETYLYVLGPTTNEVPQEVPTHMSTQVQSNGGLVVADLTRDEGGRLKVEPAKRSTYSATFTIYTRDRTKKYSLTASSWKDAIFQLIEKREALQNIDFAGMDLSDTSFRTTLKGSTFDSCNLSNCSYSYGDLRGSVFSHCNLADIRLQGTLADQTTVLKDLDLSNTDWFRVKSVVQFATLVNVTGVPKGTPSNIVLRRQDKDGSVWSTSSIGEKLEWVRDSAGFSDLAEPLTEKSTYVAITKEIAEMAKPNFKEMVLSDAEKAAYRITARSVVNLGRDAILKILAAKGGSQAEAFSLMLDTEVGTSVVSGVMGGVLTALPQFQNDARVQKLAEELRVNGMATLGNTVVDQLTELVAPAMSAMMSGAETVAARVQAPPAEVYKKPTLVQPKEELHDHEEEVETEALKSATLR